MPDIASTTIANWQPIICSLSCQASRNLPLIPGAGPLCGHVTDLINQHLAEINRRMAELRKTRTALRDLARRATEADPQSCSDADSICRIISPPRHR